MGSRTDCNVTDAGVQPCAYNSAPEQPNIRVSTFALDAYEVTVNRFRVFVTAGLPGVSGSGVGYPSGTLPWGCSTVQRVTDLNPSFECNWTSTSGTREAHPINCVDWCTAQAFCAWDGGRLPTEAEWEYAARGRSVFAEGLISGRQHPWGDVAPTSTCDRAHWNFCPGDDGVSTRRVGRFAATGNLYDLAGNVWEWSADWYIPYGGIPADGGLSCWGGTARTNPLCMDSLYGHRMVRGASWATAATTHAPGLRSASRGTTLPTDRHREIGFRCARTVP